MSQPDCIEALRVPACRFTDFRERFPLHDHRTWEYSRITGLYTAEDAVLFDSAGRPVYEDNREGDVIVRPELDRPVLRLDLTPWERECGHSVLIPSFFFHQDTFVFSCITIPYWQHENEVMEDMEDALAGQSDLGWDYSESWKKIVDTQERLATSMNLPRDYLGFDLAPLSSWSKSCSAPPLQNASPARGTEFKQWAEDILTTKPSQTLSAEYADVEMRVLSQMYAHTNAKVSMYIHDEIEITFDTETVKP